MTHVKGVHLDDFSNYAFETSSCKDYMLMGKSDAYNDLESSTDKRNQEQPNVVA